MSKNTHIGNYKAYNILHKMRYWKLRGESPDFLFDGLDKNYKDLKETDWLDLKSEVRLIWDNELKKVPNPRDHEELGYDTYRNRSIGMFEIVTSLVSCKFMYKKFSDFGQLYSLVESFSSHRLTSKSAVIVYKPKEEFFDNFRFANSCFLKGFLKALPNFESIDSENQVVKSDAKVRMTFVCFDIEKVLKDEYSFLTSDLAIKKEGTELFVNGEVYAKKIRLDTEKSKLGLLNYLFSILKRKKDFIYVPPREIKDDNLPNDFGNGVYGFYVIRDLVLDNIKILKKGEIFNAPYCRYEVKWLNISICHRLLVFVHRVIMWL